MPVKWYYEYYEIGDVAISVHEKHPKHFNSLLLNFFNEFTVAGKRISMHIAGLFNILITIK